MIATFRRVGARCGRLAAAPASLVSPSQITLLRHVGPLDLNVHQRGFANLACDNREETSDCPLPLQAIMEEVQDLDMVKDMTASSSLYASVNHLYSDLLRLVLPFVVLVFDPGGNGADGHKGMGKMQ